MFTGLIEEIGEIIDSRQTATSHELTIRAHTVLEGVALGDSIAVNGVCLTVTAFDEDIFKVGLAPETKAKSNLGGLTAGARVNLERSVTPIARMGGHFVQGHIDTVGTIKEFRTDKDALWMTVSTPAAFMKYIVPKGYIAIDGTSLTVIETGPDWFNVTLVAYTQSKIVQTQKAVGDSVNLEVDILAKYVEKLMIDRMDGAAPQSAVTETFLTQHGFLEKGARI